MNIRRILALTLPLTAVSAMTFPCAAQTTARNRILSPSQSLNDTTTRISSPEEKTSPQSRISIDRKVTPVDVDENKPQAPQLHYFDKHGKPLDEPVLIVADLDTVKTPTAKPVYPLLNSAIFGANFFDGIMKIAGQTYGSYDLWASLSLHNWFFPTLELGIGSASRHADDENYRYKCRPSMYAKLGVDYNFLYKSNPDYQAFVGLRAGLSHFSYDITDITIGSGYWDETASPTIPRQSSTALYGEALAGLRVKIYKRLSLGWTIRYHFKMHTGKGSDSRPWFIPGYGANSPITATFSVIYTLPLACSPIPDPRQQ